MHGRIAGERGLILTTNLSFSEWAAIFGDAGEVAEPGMHGRAGQGHRQQRRPRAHRRRHQQRHADQAAERDGQRANLVGIVCLVARLRT